LAAYNPDNPPPNTITELDLSVVELDLDVLVCPKIFLLGRAKVATETSPRVLRNFLRLTIIILPF